MKIQRKSFTAFKGNYSAFNAEAKKAILFNKSIVTKLKENAFIININI